MNQRQVLGWCFVVLICSSSLVSTLTHPSQLQLQQAQQTHIGDSWQPSVGHNQNAGPVYRGERKFAEKPNALKKVALDDIDADIQTNQIGGNDNGFSWSNMIGKYLNPTSLQTRN